MKKYEIITTYYERKSTRKNSKWNITYTGAHETDMEEIEKNKKDFERSPYEKYTEEYESYKGVKGIKYIAIYPNGLKKVEVIVIPIGK